MSDVTRAPAFEGEKPQPTGPIRGERPLTYRGDVAHQQSGHQDQTTPQDGQDEDEGQEPQQAPRSERKSKKATSRAQGPQRDEDEGADD